MIEEKVKALVEAGTPIERLEMRMSPLLDFERWGNDEEYSKQVIRDHDDWLDFSSSGFLGKDERLMDVIMADWETVESYRTTHQEIGLALVDLIRNNRTVSDGFVYLGEEQYDNFCEALRRVSVNLKIRGLADSYGEMLSSKQWILTGGGDQSCPWQCSSNGEVLSCDVKTRKPTFRKNDDPFYPDDIVLVYYYTPELSVSYGGTRGIIVRRELFSDGKLEELLSHFGNKESPAPYGFMPFKTQANADKLYEDCANTVRTYWQKDGAIHVPVTGVLSHLIGKHYFFEGRDVAFRAEPAFLIEALGL